ncbi:transglycosylase SLT domain-containing protein [Hyphobacterium sp.]|uniref:lytic transglycosylase domain-containing protein n=1 Tax=Hyphobacterium sp. TaxID=2004662 RepID=UPI003BA9C72C
MRHDTNTFADKMSVMRVLVLLIAMVAGTLASTPAGAQFPDPRLRPERPNPSSYLDDQDFLMLERGLEAAEGGDWSDVRDARRRISDPIARQILLWRIATSDEDTSFMELDLALDELAGWPQYEMIRSEAEFKISTSGLSPEFIVNWFEGREPVSGEGKVALGEALRETGRLAEAVPYLRDAWRNHTFRRYRQREILEAHNDILTITDHEERVDFLLWRDQRTLARDLRGELDNAHRALLDARIALAGRARGVNAAVDRVPDALSNHPGLVYERARWRRRANLDEGALEMLLQLPDTHDDPAALDDMWLERRLMILDLIRDRDYATAYTLAAANGMSQGADFADAEFVAGWLSLRYLDEPARALNHFTRLADGVSFPVSVSRGRYWQARAAEALGQDDEAERYYRLAAVHETAFYGQLAIARLRDTDPPILALPPSPVPTQADEITFESRPIARALRLLAEQGEDYLFRVFIYHLDDELDAPVDSLLLARLAQDYGHLRQGVRAAKAASYRWHILPEVSYPVIDLPPPSGRIEPEPALVHAIIRQETEFDPRAISGAGARGMMQMMPATARQTARRLGLPYRYEALTYDAEYNMRLGRYHLQEVIDEFDGSYILAMAGYNAGGHRARRWIEDYGDPRSPDVDPIDWMESIPFSETRNYVQRVLENVQVYRWRFGDGGAVPLEIEVDLQRGGSYF